MAKTPPATVERFRIHAETSKEQMGDVLAELTKMGLLNIGYELVTDVLTFRTNPDFIRQCARESRFGQSNFGHRADYRHIGAKMSPSRRREMLMILPRPANWGGTVGSVLP
jgi:hypothetical protein